MSGRIGSVSCVAVVVVIIVTVCGLVLLEHAVSAAFHDEKLSNLAKALATNTSMERGNTKRKKESFSKEVWFPQCVDCETSLPYLQTISNQN